MNNKPQEPSPIGTVLSVEEQNIVGTPLVKSYFVRVYTGEDLHSSVPAFSTSQAQDIANYYTQRGYIAEIVEA